jgi:hypothetical protein
MEGIAVRPREARPKPTETTMNLILPIDDAFEPHHVSSPTDRFIYEMQIYGIAPSRTSRTRARCRRSPSCSRR